MAPATRAMLSPARRGPLALIIPFSRSTGTTARGLLQRFGRKRRRPEPVAVSPPGFVVVSNIETRLRIAPRRAGFGLSWQCFRRRHRCRRAATQFVHLDEPDMNDILKTYSAIGTIIY